MKDYVTAFKKKIAEIDDDAQKVNIINAGVMNHGKSSLFNSLLDRIVFVENDVRETVVTKEEPWLQDVYLVDTPGLNAEETDDVEAYNAYKRANMIVFVHTIKAGELKRNELNAINIIKGVLGEKYFWSHFCLALTFLDAESESGVDAIKQKILSDIGTNCGGKGFPVFLISNSRYKKGSAENKKVLIEKSGILQLRTFIKLNVDNWRRDNKSLRKQKINRAKQELMSEINSERGRLENEIARKRNQIKQQQQDFLYDLEDAVEMYQYEADDLNSRGERLKDLRSELNDLRRKHEREHF